jgi:uncharacterized SAM-binding protein YcdF (DUF218 family)
VATGPGDLQSHPYRWLFALAIGASASYLFATAFQIMRQANFDEARPVDAIVVFGAAEYSGHPSPIFRARLDHAYQLFERGLAPLIITTGGSGRDARFSEGEVGREYLSRLGVPDVNLIAETQAGDTDQSAQRVAVILEANELKTALLVSDAYHLYRARRMMEREGITVYISPRPGSIPKTLWGRWLAALREALSYTLYRLHMT